MENLIFCAVLTAKILYINVVQAFAEGVTNLKLDKTNFNSNYNFYFADTEGFKIDTMATFQGLSLQSVKVCSRMFWYFSAGVYLFKVNNGNARIICGICSKLTIKTLERRQ